MSNAERVARFVAETTYEHIPANAIREAKNGLLDILGCAFAGARVRASKAVLALVLEDACKGKASVLTTGRKTSISQAAFANAILASQLDFDDGNFWSYAHAGAAVIPAALAAAEARHRSGRDLLAAIVIGYEITNYSGAILNAHHRDRFYGSGSGTSYGTAASVVRLIGGDAIVAGHALGIARAHLPISPILEFAVQGAMPKESIGWGAMTGSMAALLAERGFTGPPNNLDEPLHTNTSDLSILGELGNRYTIEDTYRKYFPACLWTHAAVEAALHLRRVHNLRADEVRGVTVCTHRNASTLNDPAPTSIEAAQYCIPYTVAAALIDGELSVAQMHEERLSDPRIRALASRVNLEIDPRLDEMFPSRRAARTSIRTFDGRTFEHEVLTVQGSAERRMTVDEVQSKFLRLVEPILGNKICHDIVAQIENIESLSDLSPFWMNLGHPAADLSASAASG